MADKAMADRRKQVLADLDSLSGLHCGNQSGIACERLFRIQFADHPAEPLRDFDHFPHQTPALCFVSIEQALPTAPQHMSQLPCKISFRQRHQALLGLVALWSTVTSRLNYDDAQAAQEAGAQLFGRFSDVAGPDLRRCD
jgi:hypothetical protein